ncbi:MAG: glycosyltransferase family 39 protein [Acidobacteriaceae bacterium]
MTVTKPAYHSGASATTVISKSSAWTTTLGVAVVSLVYFGFMFLRASQKPFWLDELFTIYLCRLPDFKSTWTAVAHGADFNPPLFYLLTRGAERLFGEGMIATRLPEMVGVWLFGVCLFFFVARRAGRLAGCIAGIFPFFTLAQYYAYEARPHGITLGWCGLALVCWQRTAQERFRRWWLAGFGLSLIGALMTHVYAVYLVFPFAAVELYSLLLRKRSRPGARATDWSIVSVIALALALAIAVYLPMFRTFRILLPGGLSALHGVIPLFFVNVLGSANVVLLLALGLFALGRRAPAEPGSATSHVPDREVVLLTAFACIPVLGWIGCKFSHGPFFDRYFLSSLTGYACFLGLASSRIGNSGIGNPSRRARPWIAQALAVSMFVLMVGELGLAVRERMLRDSFSLVEPASKITFSRTPRDPMSRDRVLRDLDAREDILVTEQLHYIYLFRYAPAAVVQHLYFGAPAEGDFYRVSYDRLARWAHLDMKTTAFAPFLATHNRFLVYGSADGTFAPECGDCIQTFLDAGYTLKSARPDLGGVLYAYER